MCELLGMECNTPTDLLFSFTGFSRRGGQTGPHQDGWGLAFYEGRAARVFLDPQPCSQSPLAAFFKGHSIKTELAVAHIRKRTEGPVGLANTHPFWREMWGQAWVFAHNGTLTGTESLRFSRYRPIGETDSERAFCWMLDRLLEEFSEPPPAGQLFAAVARLGSELSSRGVFNFLLGDGEHLFARCDTRLHHIVRQAPFGRATLTDDDVTVDFSRLASPEDRVAVVATSPLTRDEVWTAGSPGTLWVFRGGRLVASLDSPVLHPPPTTSCENLTPPAPPRSGEGEGQPVTRRDEAAIFTPIPRLPRLQAAAARRQRRAAAAAAAAPEAPATGRRVAKIAASGLYLTSPRPLSTARRGSP